MVISGPGSRLIFSQPSVVSFFVRLLVGYFIKTQRNTQMYAFALRNTTVNHIRGCVVKILYPTLPRFQSKMAIVWDRSITSYTHKPWHRRYFLNREPPYWLQSSITGSAFRGFILVLQKNSMLTDTQMFRSKMGAFRCIHTRYPSRLRNIIR